MLFSNQFCKKIEIPWQFCCPYPIINYLATTKILHTMKILWTIILPKWFPCMIKLTTTRLIFKSMWTYWTNFTQVSQSPNPVTPRVIYVLDAVTSSGILKAKQKLGVTFNFYKQDVIDFIKFSKMTMCRASEANS